MSSNLTDAIQERVRELPVEQQREVLEFVDGLCREVESERLSSVSQNGKKMIDLRDYGISREQAAELRASLATFEDWNAPEMDIYNDYDQALANLKQKP